VSDLLANAMAEYMERVLPAQAGPEQVQETRRAFYAGAFSILSIFNAMPEDDKVIEEEIAGLAQEVKEFLEKVKRGQA